jgi:uncharacterized protein
MALAFLPLLASTFPHSPSMPSTDPTPVPELIEGALGHPVVQWAITAAALGALLAFLTGLPALIAAGRRGDIRFDIVPPLAIAPTEVLAFFLILVLILSTPLAVPLFIPASLLGVLGLLHANGISIPHQFGLHRLPTFRVVSLGLWISLGMLAIIVPVALAAGGILKWVGWDPSPQEAIRQFFQAKDGGHLIRLALLAVVIAPVVEEVLFRGFLQPLLKKSLGPRMALVLTAALFAYVHFHVGSFVQLWVLGLALGLAYECTGSLAVSVLVHAWFNALQTGLILLLRFAATSSHGLPS